MGLIPVIDLEGGEVVRAERGARHLYAPIKTPLSPTSHPADVVAGFLALHDFRTIYVADIDAIEGRSNHAAVIDALEAEFPSISFWVDPGIVDLPQALAFFERHRSHLVIGSESLRDITTLTALSRQPALATRSVLSLDFRDDAFQGPEGLSDEPALWPRRLIVMTLARVGSNAGPDLDRLRSVAAKATKPRAIYSAGGVRGPEDLAALTEVGVQGVLIASALHDGRLDAGTIERFQSTARDNEKGSV
jgi:phosphoribosylformimino-5-aminoimidazole carboxamide ribotide isomerase